MRLENYKSVAGANRTIVRAGDMIPFAGVQTRVVVSEGPVIATPINGGGVPNPHAPIRRRWNRRRLRISAWSACR